jgi:hypothetical protein
MKVSSESWHMIYRKIHCHLRYKESVNATENVVRKLESVLFTDLVYDSHLTMSEFLFSHTVN